MHSSGGAACAGSTGCGAAPTSCRGIPIRPLRSMPRRLPLSSVPSSPAVPPAAQPPGQSLASGRPHVFLSPPAGGVHAPVCSPSSSSRALLGCVCFRQWCCSVHLCNALLPGGAAPEDVTEAFFPDAWPTGCCSGAASFGKRVPLVCRGPLFDFSRLPLVQHVLQVTLLPCTPLLLCK